MTNKRWYINIRFWPDMRKVCIYFAFIVWSQYERRYYFIPPRFGFMVTFHWGFSSCRSTVDSIIRRWRKEVVKYLTCKLARWIALRSATRLITLIQSLFTYIQSGCKSRKKQSEGCVFWSSRLCFFSELGDSFLFWVAPKTRLSGAPQICRLFWPSSS